VKILPEAPLAPEQIEYQAVLGQGWFSPWVSGGTYCGSRGMALPLLGLRVRLIGQAAEAFTCRVSATFVDGSRIGPVEDIAAMSDDLSPLEAFLIEIAPRDTLRDGAAEGAWPDADPTREAQVLELLEAAEAEKPAPTRTRPARRTARRGQGAARYGSPCQHCHGTAGHRHRPHGQGIPPQGSCRRVRKGRSKDRHSDHGKSRHKIHCKSHRESHGGPPDRRNHPPVARGHPSRSWAQGSRITGGAAQGPQEGRNPATELRRQRDATPFSPSGRPLFHGAHGAARPGG
jgi:hypothetical protein